MMHPIASRSLRLQRWLLCTTATLACVLGANAQINLRLESRDIVEKRLLDGQLSDCDLSLRELGVVVESFKNTLHSMMHSRVAYPSDRTSEKRETPSPTRLRNLPPASAA